MAPTVSALHLQRNDMPLWPSFSLSFSLFQHCTLWPVFIRSLSAYPLASLPMSVTPLRFSVSLHDYPLHFTHLPFHFLTIILTVHFKGGLLAWNKIKTQHIGTTKDIRVNYKLSYHWRGGNVHKAMTTLSVSHTHSHKASSELACDLDLTQSATFGHILGSVSDRGAIVLIKQDRGRVSERKRRRNKDSWVGLQDAMLFKGFCSGYCVSEVYLL